MKNLWIRAAALFLAIVIFVGIFPAEAAAASNKPYLIKVNKKMCTVTIYKQDKKGNYTVPIKAMLCSPGAATPLGTFKTPVKYRWRLLMGNVWGQYSTRIVDGILFHSVWYYQKDASTMSNRQYNNLGKMVSHGCVRLNVEDAKWIYDNCPLGTTVVIYNSNNPGPLGKPEGIKVSEAKTMGYDPTDIWAANNPYIKKTPTISGAKNKTISYGKKVDVKSGVKATSITGEDITSLIKTSITFNGKTVKKVDSKTPGKYKVTYKVTDPLGKKKQKTVTYTVVDDAKPTLKVAGDLYWAEDKEITKTDALEGVTASWHDKSYDVKKVTYKTTVEKETEGLKVYKVEYTLKVSNGKKATAKRKIYVDSQAPVLEGITDQEYTVESPDGVSGQLDPALLLNNVIVSDNVSKLSKDMISVVLEPVEGEYYKAIYTVKDAVGNETSVEAQVRIIQKQVIPQEDTTTESTESTEEETTATGETTTTEGNENTSLGM